MSLTTRTPERRETKHEKTPLDLSTNGLRPQSVESEAIVLGALLMGATDTPSDAYELLEPESFYAERNRIIFDAILRIRRRADPVFIESVATELREKHELEAVGGLHYLALLLDGVASTTQLSYAARIVADRAARRRLFEASMQSAQDALECDFATAQSRTVERLHVLDETVRQIKPSRLMTSAEIKGMQKPEEVLEGMLVAKSLAVLYGPSGAGKSFLALDWACCIATGFRWMGRIVIRGPVVYVAGEGAGGLGARLRAWQATREYTGNPQTYFLPLPARLHEPKEQEAVLHDIRAQNLSPQLIVVDTLARSMAGADENSAADMSAFILGADRLRVETNATVLIVHHMNKGGEMERGSTALRGAADTMIKLAKEDDVLTLTCDKQKDSVPFENMQFSLRKLADSAVLLPFEKGSDFAEAPLSKMELQVLETLHNSFLESGASATQWSEAVSVSNAAFYKARTALVRKGYVDAGDGNRGARYTLTEKAQNALLHKLYDHSTNSTGAT